MNNSAEIDFLREEICRVYGKSVKNPSDFEGLASAIENTVAQPVSISTLKRLWGYVSYGSEPRISTLDILSRYVGRTDFRDLCLELQQTSSFFEADKVLSSDLEKGTIIELGWMPDRTVRMEYMGADRYVVKDSLNSKLKEGDIIETAQFIKGQPLFIGSVLRNGQQLQAYVAGKSKGLTKLAVNQ